MSAFTPRPSPHPSRLRVAWASPFRLDARRGGWPAAHANLFAAMQSRTAALLSWHPLQAPDDAAARRRSRVITLLTGKRSLWPYTSRRLDAFASDFARHQTEPPPDAVLFFGVAEFLRTLPTVPSCCYTDSAFVPFLETYHGHRQYRAAELQRLASLEATWMQHQLRIFTSSAHAARGITNRYNVPSERVVPVGIGANLSSPPAPPHERPSPTTPSALFICTDIKRKGGARILTAIAQARMTIPGLMLDVIGDYPPDAMRQNFVRAHGWIDKDTPTGALRFAELMQTSSLFLQLSHNDLTPTAICEAAAYGLPTLASSVGGIPEMIADGTSGWLVPPDASPAVIGDRLVAALADPARRSACGQAARRAYEERWNWTSVANRIVTELEKILPSSPT